MSKQTTRVTWICTLTALLLAACSKEQTSGKESKPLAVVGDEKITEEDMQTALEAVPNHMRSKYETLTGRAGLLQEIVNNRLIVRAAVDAQLHEQEANKRRLEQYRDQILATAYQQHLVESMPKPSEQQLQKYYDEHADEFLVKARINCSWIKCATRAQAEKARRRVVDQSESFSAVAKELTIDDCSRADGGLLGYFNPTGYVRCIGNRPEFSEQVFELEAGDVGPVFAWEDGWAFVSVHEKTTERQMPFDKARDRIYEILRPRLTDEIVKQEVERLSQKYHVEMYLTLESQLGDKSADDLMRMASETQDAKERIELYTVLLKKYATYERADEARFMIGFVKSEELKDYEGAKKEFQRVLDDYPQSGLRESAQVMLQTAGSPDLPGFEAKVAPSDGSTP